MKKQLLPESLLHILRYYKKKVMKNFDVVEGNLKAVKDFDRENMWHLHIKNIRGGWESVQWLSVGRIQEFFKTKLPVAS